ncbi:unnamed protein product [Eruca vesicaria subsp. sativa]|uniref:Zinc finger GRF-type domain-containing protein n=1 Tax=Eruca vesicaria subsp. sativa TaxID=29727 RepID=A0ABC8LE58_ERUVS|nr:unnamed protein product [Eruca vesicaria subsp. sativa]
MQGDGSGSSMRRQNSGRKLCFCRLDAEIRQAWTDKNPGRRFYGCPRICGRRKMDANTSNGLMSRMVQNGKKMALLEARDEIREQSRVIEQLNETIAELTKNLERIQEEEEIVRDFQNLYV